MSLRENNLMKLSTLVIDGQITHKLDYIATININDRQYFTVFRRYNSPYNIVIEDYNQDIYFHQDHTVRTSLKTILCLTDYITSNIFTRNATSYKHNGPVPSILYDIADMRWSELQSQYQAVNINFGGIFLEPLLAIQSNQSASSTPDNQMIQPPSTPNAPERPNKDDIEAANILLSLSIPYNDTFKLSESDSSTLSMRFADIKRRNLTSCFCHMGDSDDETEDYDENNYIILRNGSMIPKPYM